MAPHHVPVIDQHDTWLAVNPVQGCPNGCAYCHLQDLHLTRTQPVELATPEETLTQLTASPYYAPHLPLALYTCTDALSTPATRGHLTTLLDTLAASPLRNPVCLSTKCPVTDDVIDCIRRNRDAGLRVIVYLSYSGLGPDIEYGIDHRALRENFPRLRQAQIPLIHYWRPALPQNSTPQAIETVTDWAFRYADCTVAVGTKIKPTAVDQIAALWPQVADPHLNPQAADSLWPRTTWDWLARLPDDTTHPIFHTNSCALAYLEGRAERTGVLDTPTCLIANRCPAGQRRTCQHAALHPPAVSPANIDQHLARIGHPALPYTFHTATRTLVLARPVALRDRHSLTQVLGLTVRAPDEPTERYWAGHLSGADPLVVDTPQ